MKLPYQLNEAAFLANHGNWDMATYRMTPHWLVEQVYFVWKLREIADKADARKARNDAKPKT